MAVRAGWYLCALAPILGGVSVAASYACLGSLVPAANLPGVLYALASAAGAASLSLLLRLQAPRKGWLFGMLPAVLLCFGVGINLLFTGYTDIFVKEIPLLVSILLASSLGSLAGSVPRLARTDRDSGGATGSH
jgi:hypothetical protein